MGDVSESLLTLAHQLGREDRRLAILGEGNVSARIGAETFLVKASGCSLETLRPEDLAECKFDAILPLLDKKRISDDEVATALFGARVGSASKKPSTETMFHAWLLTLDDVHFVGHCHPVFAGQVLCSPRARDFAERRLFPDEVVCCGAASVFVPYTDPGIPLAREVRERTMLFQKAHGSVPRLILLQNHGIIALGSSSQAVLACVLMAAKAAEIFVGAAALGGPNFMNAKDVERIHTRPDEGYRQKVLKLAE